MALTHGVSISQRMTLIGVGLMGGSLARSLRAVGACTEIIGHGRNTKNLALAVELGVIDRYETDLRKAVEGADLIVLAVPLGAMSAVFGQLATCLGPGVVLSDVGSAKASVVAAARQLGDQFPSFVPAHPIAGTEKSGVENSLHGLFENHYTIITPVPETDPDAIQRIRSMWDVVGARTVLMDVAHHDDILADTSHLPHMLAFALVSYLYERDGDASFRYAAGGFRDFTRIASSDPVMWRDICLANSDAIRKALQGYRMTLDRIDGYLAEADADNMLRFFTDAKQQRDQFLCGASRYNTDQNGRGGADV